MTQSYLLKIGTDDVADIEVHVYADDPADAIAKVRQVLGDEVTIKTLNDSDRPHGLDQNPATEKRRAAWRRMVWPD